MSNNVLSMSVSNTEAGNYLKYSLQQAWSIFFNHSPVLQSAIAGKLF